MGKTLSARHYAGSDDWEQWQTVFEDDFGSVPPRVLEAHTAFFTPSGAATMREIDRGLPTACQRISFAIDYHEHGLVDPYVHTDSRSSGRTELLIIDEADRLKTTGLEQVRDYFDRHNMGVILIPIAANRCLVTDEIRDVKIARECPRSRRRGMCPLIVRLTKRFLIELGLGARRWRAGRAIERSATLAAARAQNPERFSTTQDPKILTLHDTVWINKPAEQDEVQPAVKLAA